MAWLAFPAARGMGRPMTALTGRSVCSISDAGPLGEYGPAGDWIAPGLAVEVGLGLVPPPVLPALPARPKTSLRPTAATTMATTAAAAAAGIRNRLVRGQSVLARRPAAARLPAPSRAQAAGWCEYSPACAVLAAGTRSSRMLMACPPRLAGCGRARPA